MNIGFKIYFHALGAHTLTDHIAAISRFRLLKFFDLLRALPNKLGSWSDEMIKTSHLRLTSRRFLHTLPMSDANHHVLEQQTGEGEVESRPYAIHLQSTDSELNEPTLCTPPERTKSDPDSSFRLNFLSRVSSLVMNTGNESASQSFGTTCDFVMISCTRSS